MHRERRIPHGRSPIGGSPKRAVLPLLLALFIGLHSAPFSPVAMRVVDPAHERIGMHWRSANDSVIGHIGKLRELVEAKGDTLLFAMNGGMFDKDQGPVGLYIEDGELLHPINRRTEGYGNFHLQPNGVFGIYTDGRAFVRRTADVRDMLDIRYATQSGPMLVVGGRINDLFKAGSANLYVRNGVGIRPDGNVVFGISLQPVNFHDFASWFVDQGCTDALYLDGSVSKAYIPGSGIRQMDGELGVLIAVASRPGELH